MTYDAVFFDAAETLFTTQGAVGEIYGRVAARFGSKAPAAAIQAAFEKQFPRSGPLTAAGEKQWWKDIVRRVFMDVGMIDDFDRFFEQVYEQFRDARGWMLFPETRDVLTKLRQRGVQMGIVSNFDSRIYTVLESLGIRSFFETVTISSEVGAAKPQPEIFHAAVRAAGLPASRILMVGDSLEDDVRAAQAAGLGAVLLDRKGRYAEIQDVRVIETLSDLAADYTDGNPA